MNKFSHATKYTVIICIGLVIYNLIFGYVLIKVSANALRTQINERMLDISNTAAAMIDGDDMAKITKDDYGSPEYQEIMDTLTYFQENIELSYIYCIIQVSEKEFVFGVDPTIEDPGEFGSPIVYTDALYAASKGKPGVDEVPYKDEWGVFYSSYSPVYDSNGDVAGVVAADFSADWYHKKLEKLVMIVVSFIAFALVCSICLAILITSQYRKLFKALLNKMNDLSGGIETLVNEVAPEIEGEERQLFTESEDNKNMSDSMDALSEKILVMQMRLASQVEIVRSHAYIDGLTGMNNRTSYMEYLQVLQKKLEENRNYIFSVIVFDINQLKIINDDYGHDKGDKLIVGIAGDIREVFGGNRIYRVGGDEFVAICDDPDPSDKIARVKTIISKKNKESPVFHDSSVEIGLSIGYATYDPSIDTCYADVFDRADNAMYADKRAFYQTHEDRRKKRGR